MRTKNRIIWLLASVFVLSLSLFIAGCKTPTGDSSVDENKLYTVSFDTCIDLPTNKALDQKLHKGDFVKQPDIKVRGSNPDGKRVSGWYEDKDYENEWDFGLDKVTGDMTLYAKWDSYYAVRYYLANSAAPVFETEVKGGRRAARADDSVYGYKIKGYYSTSDFEKGTEFDFTKPINKTTDIYIDAEDYFYFDGASIANAFRAVAAPSGQGSTAGNIVRESKNGEEYARVNFGYSTARDPYICAEALNADITRSQIIEIKFKNLGSADQLMFYWLLKDENGAFIGSSDYSGAQSVCYSYQAGQTNMKEDDDWIVLRINAAANELSFEGNNLWKDGKRLYAFRIQSLYTSKSSSDLSNELLIDYVKGVYDEKYDSEKMLVKFNFNGIVRETRVDEGSTVGKEKAALNCSGYNVLGYYKDSAYTQEFDVGNTMIIGETEIFVKTDGKMHFDGKGIYEYFKPTASTRPGSTVGHSEMTADGNVKVNFGYSIIGDPSITISDAKLDISNVKKIKVKLKNLGKAPQLALYWTAKDANGEFIGGSDYAGGRDAWCTLSKMQMSADDEWLYAEFDLSTNANWTSAKELVKLRIQSVYASENEKDLSNEMIFAEIIGE